MDAELLQLQKQFEAAQQAKSSVRLSERNIVELVSKLQELGLLQPPLLHTVSGKEYLTQDHLRYEMELEIKRLGRISLIDLATSIGVDLFYCERQADLIISSSTDLMLYQGEIISTSYWDTVAEDINESLQEAGQIALADLAARLNVGSDILTAMLESRLSKYVQGKLEGGQLYTQAYVARLRSMIRGAVRALTVPTNLSTVWASLQQQLLEINESSGSGLVGEGKLFQSLFSELLKEGAFSGSLRGGGSVWTPVVFEKAQHESVESFYSQNSYISYDMLRKLSISQPKNFLQGKYADGIALDTVFVHSSLISMVDAAVEEVVVDGGGWTDCVALVPPLFSFADVARFVSLCPCIEKAKKESKAVTLAETCVLSTSFLKVLLEKLETEVKALVSNSSLKRNTVGAGNGSTTESRDAKDVGQKATASQGKGGKRKATGVASAKATMDEFREDDHGLAARGSKGKKKGGKFKAGSNPSLGGSGALNKAEKDNSERGGSKEDEVLSEDYIASRVVRFFPELEGAGIDEEDDAGMLSKAIAAYIRPSLMSTWEKAKQASFTKTAEERRQRAEMLQKKTDDLYANLQLFVKALDLFDDDPTTLTTLHRHLLRTTASELSDVILRTQDFERRFDNGDVCNSSLMDNTKPLNGSEKLSLAKGFTGPLSTKFVRMVETLDGKVVEEFDVALQVVAEECGLHLRKLDKKAEKSLLSTYRKELTSEIERESDPVTLLPKVVALLFTQVFNKALQAPGRAIASAINRLQKIVPEYTYSTLVDYQTVTVAMLSMISTSTSGGSDCTSSRIEDQQEKLESMMPHLKDIVLRPQSNV